METTSLSHFTKCCTSVSLFGLKHHDYNSDYNIYKFEPIDHQVELVPVIDWQDYPYHYTYKGKESQDGLGLDWYDYGTQNSCPDDSRRDMPDLGRRTTVDPLAEERMGISPYSYVQINPLK